MLEVLKIRARKDVYKRQPVKTMKDCSVVTATYELGDGVKGTIGIIGPKRMDYENVLKSMKRLQSELRCV